MPINRKLQNIIGTEHITDAAENAIAAQAEGGATLAFKNVAVSGQSNIVADVSTDTLNIAAGANVTITTNAGTDTITIAATDTNTDTNTFRPVTAGGNTLASNETLAFTAGSNVTISESAGAVTIAATGGSPGGSDTHIQYNNGGSFGGISSFAYTDTANSEKFVISASSDQDLVRITQTGTGKALVVEDSTNVDSTPFEIDANGKVGINGAANTSGAHLYVGGRIHTSDQFRAGTGTDNLPIYSFISDTATGMRGGNDGTVRLITAGNERFRVASAGQFGIAGANYGTAGQVLTSGGASAAPSWAAAGGGGAVTSMGSVNNANPPTFTNDGEVTLGWSDNHYGFPAHTAIQQASSIGPGNYSGQTPALWPCYWPTDKGYVDTVKVRIYSASTTGGAADCKLGLYKADANGFPTNRICEVDISPTSTGNHFVTITLSSGASAHSLSRGEMFWVGLLGPNAINWASPGNIRFYGQNTTHYTAAGPFSGSGWGPNPGYKYDGVIELQVSNKRINAWPSDILDVGTYSFDNTTNDDVTMKTDSTMLGAYSYRPYIQLTPRTTA